MYYVVRTPRNPEFAGKVYGVQFNAGKAIISKDTISTHLGWDVEQIAKRMKDDFGYEVEKVGDVPAAVPVETGEPPVQGTGVSKKK